MDVCLPCWHIIDANGVAEAFGYTKEQLESIPVESNMGLSCGNPVASATIKPVSCDVLQSRSRNSDFSHGSRERWLSI